MAGGLGTKMQTTQKATIQTDSLPRQDQRTSSWKAVQWWALFGGALFALQIFVWTRWITGPYFERVPTGPSDPPTWMKITLTTWTILGIPVVLVVIYRVVIRPWRRERRITTDAMLLGAFGLFYFQDPMLNYGNTWSTYNSYLFNMGSWVQNTPGWLSWGKPGQMFLEPIALVGPGYMYGCLLWAIGGCWAMRAAKKRWPNIGVAGLLGVAFVFNVVMDIIVEGVIMVPMGWFVYQGAIRSLSINAGKYYQYPIYEGFLWGSVMTAICALRYFKDDRGRTFVERGLENIRGGFTKTQSIRFLAIFGACSLFFFVGYNLPAQWFGMHGDPWPEDIQKRSYFTNGLCGEGTGRLCPGPVIPIDRGEGSASIRPDGTVVLPDGVELPKIVPYDRAK